MYNDVIKYVRACEECQLCSWIRQEESLHPMWTLTVWEKVGIDVVYMPKTDDGFGFIVFARDHLSGRVERRPIKAANAKEVAKFISEDVICRHGCPQRIVLDRESENLNMTKEHYQIKRTVVSAFHPQPNGLVERCHDSIVNSLSKHCNKNPMDWVKYLPLALWADRISIRRSTGHSPFELVYGQDSLLPGDFTLESWSVVDWEGKVKTLEDLLIVWMRQLDQRVLTEAQASRNLRNSRNANKAYYDDNYRLRTVSQQLHIGELVLLHNTKASYSWWQAHKLNDRWFGPYRIRPIPDDSTVYRLEELDGTPLVATMSCKCGGRHSLLCFSVAGSRRYGALEALFYDLFSLFSTI